MATARRPAPGTPRTSFTSVLALAPLVPLVGSFLVLALICGGWNPATTHGPRAAGTQPPRAQMPGATAPYEIAPTKDCEPTAALRGSARHRDRRRPATRPAGLPELPPGTPHWEPRTTAPGGTHGTRRTRAGPTAVPEPSALQVFRC
ncbi:hypothetical protein ACIGEZ_28075 [Streptomyces sp. NPDC085481]|uniref:hypothetical protein n=1 Tax=Streptomyces sp. NPDC085481 TaxID=3365727 RepID=UPI0037CF584E